MMEAVLVFALSLATLSVLVAIRMVLQKESFKSIVAKRDTVNIALLAISIASGLTIAKLALSKAAVFG
jgi:hypothetical protein